jgi:hypothetical protein
MGSRGAAVQLGAAPVHAIPKTTPAVKPVSPSHPGSARAIVLCIAAAYLLLHLATAGRYGLFRDELYYVDCSRHLDWGYVDHPPLIALVTWLVRHLLGESMLALRLLPAISGAALVWLTGEVTAEMGGGRFAQALAALAVFFVPYYFLLLHLLTMNAFEPLIWLGCAWCVVRAVNTSDPRYWLPYGIIAGVGMENKYSMAFFAVGTLVGLLLTPFRTFLASRWMGLGVLAAVAIFLPNLVWLVRHHFPFLELMHNVRMSGRDIGRPPLAFVADQAMVNGPLLFPLWAAGLVWLLGTRKGRRYGILGITFLVVFGTLMVLKGKNYYVSPVYPMIFAAGSVALEDWTARRWRGARFAYVAAVVISGALIAPIVLPILPVETLIGYLRATGYPPPTFEHQRTAELPQYFADDFGWEEMARGTAVTLGRLSPADRAKAVIFANNYGEAAAIDFYGPKYGLPGAICPHQSYWLWGPDHASGALILVLGSDGSGDREHFRTVEAGEVVDSPHAQPYEHFTIWVCRDLNFDLAETWPQMKRWR